MDDLQKELSGSGVKYKNGSVNRLSCKISFKGFMDRHSIDICIVHKPYDLITK